MKSKTFIKVLVTVLVVLALSLSLVIFALATDSEIPDAMPAIRAAFADKQVGGTTKVADEGYIGIPVEITTYYDYETHGTAKSGYNGTVVAIYVINTNTERTGSKSDVEIISSMLERGYVVSVLDYLGNNKAKSPDLDWSTQTIRKEFLSGKYYTDRAAFASGKYNDNFIVPAGYDISYGNVFWEADKHGADGTLEKIVENWNTDFRGWFAETLVYWCTPNGARKETQKGIDGSEPVWRDKSGNPDENGCYVQAQHTLALDVTDCVAKDGTPIDLNLYMHIVYPTTTAENPLEAVPIAVLANSSEYLTTASTSSGLRPQHNGFLFRGYAGAAFDYLYQPMAQADYYGYYDGRTELGAMTGDRMNYGLQLYNDKRINTAAMRYLRYLTLTEPETYSFDIESIGVFGNSKGGWFTFLGEAELRNLTLPEGSDYTKAELEALMDTRINNYTSKRQFSGHDNETRYQNGIVGDYTRNGVTIDGGELQPWLTYTDDEGNTHEILSYVNWVYASNGSNFEDITEGHSPLFAALHLQDDFTVTNNAFGEIAGSLDIPAFYVIVDLGHTFAYGPEYHYGYDTYDAMFAFANYYLKDAPVEVIYTTPHSKTGNVATGDPIVIKFSGAVTAEEIAKVSITSSLGVKVNGIWSSRYGGTEWTFTPEDLLPSETYSLTVPAALAGDNGVAMGADYTAVFYTAEGTKTEGSIVTSSVGTFLVFSESDIAGMDGASVSFFVSNDAANVAKLYAVKSYNEADAASSVIGDLVGEVSLYGKGYYDIDASAAIAAANGEKIVFLLKCAKEAGTTDTVYDLTTSVSKVSLGSYARAAAGSTAPDGSTATAFHVVTNISSSGNKQYPNQQDFYANTSTLFSLSNIFGSSDIKAEDLGRLYTVKLRVYDTVSRTVSLVLNGAYTSTNGVHDKDRANYNIKTTAGEWTDITFTYRVYEPLYGDTALAKKKLTVSLEPDGNRESKIYVDSITVTEEVTAVQIGAAAITAGKRGSAYKTSSAAPFAIGSTTYSSLYSALNAAKEGDTVTMKNNYTVLASDSFYNLAKLGTITLDLGGYKLYCRGASAIYASATSNADKMTYVNIKNGDVYLYSNALIGFTGSTAAGAGKSFTVTLDGVRILNANGSRLQSVIADTAAPAASRVNLKVRLDGCTLDVSRAANVKNPLSVFPNGEGNLDISYELIGGSIICDGYSDMTFFDNFKKMEFSKDSEGNYTTLVAPTSAGEPGLSIMRSDGVAAYEAGESVRGMTTLTVEKSALSTKYGLVPEKYADANAYPFVVFDKGGNFLGAATTWLGSNGGSTSALGIARNHVVNAWDGTSYGADPYEAYVVMRRNYTLTSSEYFDNLAQTQGTVYVDLGGYTLSAGTVTKALIPAASKGYSGAAGEKMYPTTLIISNGTMRAYNQGIIGFQCWDTIGDGSIRNKLYTFIFNNVTFGVHSSGVNSVSLLTHFANPKTKTEAAPVNIEYNDCTFDLKTATSSSAMRLFVTSTDGKYISLKTQVNGGQIITSDSAKVVVTYLGSDNYGSSVTFNKGSDGEYLKFITAKDKTVDEGSYTSPEGELYFQRGAENGNEVTYNLVKNPNSTPYGTIPSQYADANLYPFVAFNEKGEFNGAYAYAVFCADSGSSAFAKSKDYLKANVFDSTKKTYNQPEKSVVILMRRDYTALTNERLVNFAQVQGTITLDLGGYTYSQNASATYPIFHITAKGWSGSGDAAMFPTTFNVKNGKLLVTKNGVIGFNAWESVGNGAIADKVMTFNFDDVTFGYANGATTANLLYYSNAINQSSKEFTVPAPLYINYNGCTFDLKTNSENISSVTLFNASCKSGEWIKNTMTVSGCTIIADSLDGVTFVKTESVYGSTVTFDLKTTLELAEGAQAPTFKVMTKGGERVFSESDTVQGRTSYRLTSLITEYGTIPEKYASVADYPFVVFNTKGEFVAACAEFYGNQADSSAIGKALYTVLKHNVWDPTANTYGSGEVGAIILMRRDYMLGAAEKHDNLAHAQGTVTIDLGGYTLSENPETTLNRAIFHAVNKRWDSTYSGDAQIFPSTYNVKNGSFALYQYGLMHAESWDCTAEGWSVSDKVFTWRFTDVTFALQPGASVNNLLIKYNSRSSNSGEQIGKYVIEYNNCTFDLRTIAPTVGVNLFDASVAASYDLHVDFKINGGKLLANSLDKITILKTTTKADHTVTFTEDFKVILGTDAAYPDYATAYPLADGSATLTRTGTEGGYAVYSLIRSIKTDYGYIPARYASVEDYPFVIFRNGSFIFATAIFGKDATDSALHKSKTNGSVILLRRDFEYKESQYNNLSQTSGSITIDLGGHTIWCRQSGTNSFLFAQKKTTYDSSVTVINGTILTAKNPIVSFSCWAGSSGAYGGGAHFNITFENVTLGADKGTSPKTLIATTVQGLSEPTTYATLTLRDCTIDLRGLCETTLFYLADDNGVVINTAKLVGGKILADSMEGITLYTISEDRGSTFTFDRGEDGNYVIVELPAEAAAPTGTFTNTLGNKLSFVRVDNDGDDLTYTLAPKKIGDIKVYTSVTLYSDFVLNVYVSVSDIYKSITLGGETYDIASLELATHKGVQCYVIRKPVPVTASADDFVLKLETTGGTGSYVINIVRYAERVLLGDYSAEEKTLMRDMLAYIKAAYTYYNGTGVVSDEKLAAATALVDSVLGEHTAEKPASLDTAVAKNSGAAFTEATVYVGAEISFAFKAKEGAENFMFFIGGRPASYEVKGEYIYVKTYAYGIRDTVTYTATLGGVEVKGEYNLKAYYDYVSGEGSATADLISLVEGLWQYSESASAYRDYVNEQLGG